MGGETPVKTNLGEKNEFGPFVLFILFISHV
jgi:hypothetical protein